MKKITTLVGVALGMTALGACGSTATNSESTGSTDNVPDAVTQLVAEASEPAPWAGPTTSPPMLEDKFIVSIPCSMAAPGCVRWNDGVKAAAEHLGWTVQTIDPAFDVNKMNDAMNQAINLGADAIVTTAIDPAWIASSLAKARRAGIPVLGGANAQEGVPITEDGFSHNMSLHGELQGQWIAAKACQDVNAEGQALIVTDPSFAVLTQRVDSIQAYLGENCPDIDVEVVKVAASDAGTVLQNKISALVQRNPDLDAIISPVDLFATDTSTAIQQLGNTNVGVYSIDGDPAIVEAIANGGPIKSTVGSALEWEGWATIDEANRLMQNEPPLEDDGVPGRLVSEEVIPPNNAYVGDLDYEAMFTELWETGKLNP